MRPRGRRQRGRMVPGSPQGRRGDRGSKVTGGAPAQLGLVMVTVTIVFLEIVMPDTLRS